MASYHSCLAEGDPHGTYPSSCQQKKAIDAARSPPSPKGKDKSKDYSGKNIGKDSKRQRTFLSISPFLRQEKRQRQIAKIGNCRLLEQESISPQFHMLLGPSISERLKAPLFRNV